MRKSILAKGIAVGLILMMMAAIIFSGGMLLDQNSSTTQAGQTKKTSAAMSKANSRGRNLSNIWTDGGYTIKGCYTGNYYYYASYNCIYKLNLHTNKKQLVKKLDCFNVNQVLFYNNTLYFVEDTYQGTGGSYTYVSKMSINGKNYKRMSTGDPISIAGGRIYYVTVNGVKDKDGLWKNTGIGSMSLSGKNKKQIIKTEDVYTAVCDGKHIYYQNQNGKYRTDLLGKVIKKVASAEWQVVGLYKNDLYYVRTVKDGSRNDLYIKNLGSGKTKRIVKNVTDFGGKINVENGKLYYVIDKPMGQKETIYERNMKTGKTKVITKEKNIYEISIYGNHVMYSYDTKDNNITSKVYNMKTKKKVKLGTYYVS